MYTYTVYVDGKLKNRLEFKNELTDEELTELQEQYAQTYIEITVKR